MLVLLVRHGHAGTKRQWEDDDDGTRPLDEQGLAQSVGLVPLLTPFVPVRILSSPLLRCTQSIGPLSRALGLEVERSPSLTPDAGPAARKLALTVTTGESGTLSATGAVVLCTHGEVIREMQANFGKHAPSNFNLHAPREKGSIWVLERSRGRFVNAKYLAPLLAGEGPA